MNYLKLDKVSNSFIIFIYFFVVRFLYVFITGFSPYELSSDTGFINELSDRVLNGNFNFDIGRFIVAPFYNIFLALHKIIFQIYWKELLIFNQILISSISGIYFYKLGVLLFRKKVALLATILFGVFPMTLYWVHTFATESIFQSLLIISLYFLVKSTKTLAYKDLIISAIIFSIVFLTKSHILLFTPFIAIYFFINIKNHKKIFFPALFAVICFISTTPFGLYNKKIHNQYVLSSNGSKFHFYTGNSEFGYKSVVDVPEKNSLEFKYLKDFNLAYFNGEIHNEIMKLPHSFKQDEYLKLALKWIKDNPNKFIKLKVYDILLFLTPGVSFRHYSIKSWLFSFLISAPVYLLAYFGLYRETKRFFKKHFISIGLFFSMVLFSVIWYVQNRFRVITIEPIYILYCSSVLISLIENQYFKKQPSNSFRKKCSLRQKNYQSSGWESGE